MPHALLSVGRERLCFHYDSYDLSADGAEVLLRYAVTGDGERAEFTERIALPADPGAEPADPVVFERVVRLLWLAAGLSYFKAFAPHEVSVAQALTERERSFLESLFVGGLAEYAYRNDLPDALTPRLLAESRAAYGGAGATRDTPVRSVLVPVGGGKDSIDTIETLRGHVDELRLFSVNDFPAISATAEQAGLPILRAARSLDPALFELNREGALNGHVPVTAVNSTIAVLSAMRLGADSVAFSNERSASYGNLVWHGREINHQWSKSIEFERLLRSALADAGCPVSYFSLLRPLSELAIVRRFAALVEYHPVFTSCNRAFRIDREHASAAWCGDCPKCRFVYLMMAPFVTREQLVAIFGHDLFEDPAQEQGFAELIGLHGHKPFECVGEIRECAAAWTLLKRSPEWSDHPFVGRDFGGRTTDSGDAEIAEIFTMTDEHCLPAGLEELVRAAH